MKTNARKRLEQTEIARFDSLADGWWDADGTYWPLHRLNPVRLAYIRDAALVHFRRKDKTGRTPLAGLTVLDVGCGGGLLCEPLARMGGVVTGIDASAPSIKVASAHAAASDLTIDYRDVETGKLIAEKKVFDIVCALEIVEHVAVPEKFVAELARLVKPGGMLVMSTLNRTAKGFLFGIIAAEYIMRMVPRGMHQWRKFLRPSELTRMIELHGLTVQDCSGMVFDVLKRDFRLSERDLDVNYLLWAVKKPQS